LAFATHPHHAAARRAFEASDSAHPAAFCRVTQSSFLRLITTPAIQGMYGIAAITNEEAWSKYQDLLVLP
jgi:predicted nucleic acid-binding protein